MGYPVCTCLAPYYHTKDYSNDQSHRLPGVGKAIRILEEGTHSLTIRVPEHMSRYLPQRNEIVDSNSFNSQGPVDENKILEVFRWNTAPDHPANGGESNASRGREWVADLPREGGNVDVVIDDTWKWISINARVGQNAEIGNNNTLVRGYWGSPFLYWNNTNIINLYTFVVGADLTGEINSDSTFNGSVRYNENL